MSYMFSIPNGVYILIPFVEKNSRVKWMFFGTFCKKVTLTDTINPGFCHKV